MRVVVLMALASWFLRPGDVADVSYGRRMTEFVVGPRKCVGWAGRKKTTIWPAASLMVWMRVLSVRSGTDSKS